MPHFIDQLWRCAGFRRLLSLTILLALIRGNPAVAEAPAGATIEGVVKLPQSKGGAVAPPRYKGSRITPDAPDLPMAAVYLEGDFPVPNGPLPTVDLEQKNLQFRPNLLVIQAGSSVRFPNMDDEHHNVISFSRTKKLDLGRYKRNETAPVHVFDRPGVVDLNCDVHTHMKAFIVVVKGPHFTKSDPEGRFALTNVPPGNFVLKAWVGLNRIYSRPVTVKAGERLTVDLTEAPAKP